MKSEEEPVVHKYRQVSDEEDAAKVDNDKEKGEEDPKLMFILIDR